MDFQRFVSRGKVKANHAITTLSHFAFLLFLFACSGSFCFSASLFHLFRQMSLAFAPDLMSSHPNNNSRTRMRPLFLEHPCGAVSRLTPLLHLFLRRPCITKSISHIMWKSFLYMIKYFILITKIQSSLVIVINEQL